MSIFPRFQSESSHKNEEAARALKDKKILLIATGSISAMYLPAWVSWFREAFPDTKLRIILSKSAKGFLGMAALKAFTRDAVDIDSWQEHSTESFHVELEQWAEAIVVYPATASFIARYATGACDSPAMLALQCTNVPIVFAPALPPGMYRNEAWKIYDAAIGLRSNATIIPPIHGYSSLNPALEAYPPRPFNSVIAELAGIISDLQTANSSTSKKVEGDETK